MGKDKGCHTAECCETVEVHEELLEIVNKTMPDET